MMILIWDFYCYAGAVVSSTHKAHKENTKATKIFLDQDLTK
jgi:hypothetical protein